MDNHPSMPPVRRRDLRRRADQQTAAGEGAAEPVTDEPSTPAAEPVSAAAPAPDQPATTGESDDARHRSTHAAVVVEPARRRRLLALLLGLTVLIASVDQVTKYIAEDRLSDGVVVPILGDVLGFQLVHNPGAAFSLATGMTWVFTVVMVIVAVAVLRVSRKLGSTTWAVALGMLLGGCLGNLYDRLFRPPGFARGHVVDFINYNGWFVGNVADIAIVAAAILIALLALRGREIDGSRVTETQPADEPGGEQPEDATGEASEPGTGDDSTPDDSTADDATPDDSTPDDSTADGADRGRPGDHA